jgi:D-xylose transport system substrate-binding protein
MVIGATLVAAGCGGSDGTGGSSASDAGGKKIGVSMYSQVQGRWKFDAAAFEREAKKKGDQVIMTYANADPEKQTSDVQSLLSKGIDVLVIAATDTKVGGSLIAQAKREGVKTIAYDIGVEGAAPDWHIVRKQSDVAKMQIAAAKKAAPSGKYVVIKGDAGNDLAQASSPVYATLKNDPAIQVVYDDWTPGYSAEKALQVAEAQLTQYHDDIQAFLANADTLAEPVGQAIKERRLSGKTFLAGLDAEPAALRLIAEGAMTMSIWTPIDQMGKTAADAADDLAHGRAPAYDDFSKNDVSSKIPTAHVRMQEVNRANLCDFITKVAPRGWASVKDVFGRPDGCD